MRRRRRETLLSPSTSIEGFLLARFQGGSRCRKFQADCMAALHAPASVSLRIFHCQRAAVAASGNRWPV